MDKIEANKDRKSALPQAEKDIAKRYLAMSRLMLEKCLKEPRFESKMEYAARAVSKCDEKILRKFTQESECLKAAFYMGNLCEYMSHLAAENGLRASSDKLTFLAGEYYSLALEGDKLGGDYRKLAVNGLTRAVERFARPNDPDRDPTTPAAMALAL
ncbi:MAG: hypothetical protein P4M13_03470 [Alphaproteobacteria bacterium]|nr:hypothetical protein [Alphaproteobacteria bacterium]